MEISTTHVKLPRRSRIKSSDGSHLQQRSVARATNHPFIANVKNRMTAEGKTRTQNTRRSPEANSRTMAHSGFDDRCSGKRTTSYTEPSMSINA